jgi:hypothetical protein
MIDEKFVRNAMFLGHAPNHAPDVFRFLNLATKHVIISRNAIWLNKIYSDWKTLEPAEIVYVAYDEDDNAPDPGWEEGAEEADGGNDGEIIEEEDEDRDHEDEDGEEEETPNPDPNPDPQISLQPQQPPPPIQPKLTGEIRRLEGFYNPAATAYMNQS